MKVVTVTPINKGVFKDTLTYFSAQDVPLGAIVSVPIRQKALEALVVDSRDAGTMKSELRSSDFTLKKITEIKSTGLFLPAFLSACQTISDYYAVPLGQAIKTTLPQTILENLSHSHPVALDKKREEADEDRTIKQNKFIFQDDDDGRISYYKSWIRESFAKKQSVLLCLPTAIEADRYSKAFGSGIENYTVVLHADLSKKALWSAWNKAIAEEHPLLVIATPTFLSLPRTDLKTIIIEKESSSAYKNISRPHIDFRQLAERLAENLEARFILGDLVLRAETIFKAERGDYAHLSGLKYRSVSEAEQYVLEGKNRDTGDKTPYALGDDTRELIRYALSSKEKIVIYSGRKGIAPNTICNDCGQVVHCPRCKNPLVLHKNKAEKKYFYACHKCGGQLEVKDLCPSCQSWRLALIGFGIEKVEEELKELFPETSVFRLDADSAKPGKREEIASKFYGTKGGAILLGTEMILHYLEDKVPNILAVAIDGAFSLPDFRISERMLGVLLRFRQRASKRFSIQTRNPGEKVFSYATKGNLIEFYREEIEERMKFGYPPFKVLVKITREGKQDAVERDMEHVSQLLSDYKPTIFPAFISEIRGRYRMHALIKVSPSRWPNPDVLAILKSLPPDFIIDVEPDSIL